MAIERVIPVLDWKRIDILIAMALDEDLGETGDVTTTAVIPSSIMATANFIAKENLVCAGIDIARRVMTTIDPNIKWSPLVYDGQSCPVGTVMIRAEGSARSLLTAERTALNFLQRLSGIATISNRYVNAVGTNKTKILDTRKTTPGWRNLEKYAVAIGGANCHRFGLYDRILIKDNHLEILGRVSANGISHAVMRAKMNYPELEIEVEADTLEQVKEAVESGANYILLDNMSNAQMSEAVRINAGRSLLEASGGITLERISEIAALGVDFISVGALTHSVKASDISLDIVVQ